MPDKLQEANALTKCKHHWKIAKPDGERSLGVCRKCGAKHDFENWSDRVDYGGLRKIKTDGRIRPN